MRLALPFIIFLSLLFTSCGDTQENNNPTDATMLIEDTNDTDNTTDNNTSEVFESERVVARFGFEADTENFSAPFSGACDVSHSSTEQNQTIGSLFISNKTETYYGGSISIQSYLAADTLYVIRGKLKSSTGVEDTYALHVKIEYATPEYRSINRILVNDQNWNHFKAYITFTQEEIDAGIKLYVTSDNRKDDYYLDDIEIVTTEYKPSALSSSDAEAILKISGNKIIDENSNTIKIKGINVIAYSDDQNVESSTVWNYSYYNIDQYDMQRIQAMGFNAIRLSLWYKFFEEDSNPNTYKESGFQWLDTIIGWAKEHHIYVMLDMHAPQGDGFQGPNSSNAFWTDDSYKTRFKNLWKAIAKRYKNEPTVYAYDLINEPCPPAEEDYRTLIQDTISLIRTEDPNHIINVEVSFASNGTDAGNPFQLDNTENIIYDFHYYDPWDSYTDDSSTVYGEGSLNKTTLTSLFEDFSDFYTTRALPYTISEFGQKYATYSNKNAQGWISDFFDIMKDKGTNAYFYFSYKGNEFSLYNNQNKYSYSLEKNDALIELLKEKNKNY
jgi:aryl-phospho-beta-D-glucosidase BglC (GH1 family)